MRKPGNLHTYRLAVLRLPGGPEAMDSPLVYLSGGPGVSAFNGAFLKVPLTDVIPVIAINQRGAYLSQPDLFPIATDETVIDIQERLGGQDGIDFNTINTRHNAADILDVMTALGYTEPFNLWGTSYGTMLAQEVIRQAPERVRAAVLDGVVTMDQPQWTTIAQGFADALQALFDDIAGHPQASRFYPAFREQFFSFAAGLAPENREAFFESVFQAMNLSRWGYIENLPAIIWRACHGDRAALEEVGAVRLPEILPPAGVPISANMYYATLRQDFLPFETMATAEGLLASVPFPLNEHGYAYSRYQYVFSEDWAFLEPAPASFRTPVREEVPVLVLNGTYDTQTGMAGARHVAAHLPNATLVELPTIGHAVLFGGEAVSALAREFLMDPLRPVDTSAVAGLSLDFAPPWPSDAPQLATEAPVAISFESGDAAVWYRFSTQRGIIYEVASDGPGVHIINKNADVLFTAGQARQWLADEDAELYLMVVPHNAGNYRLKIDRPLLIRRIEFSNGECVLEWQGPTGTTNSIQAATNLTDPDPWILFHEMPVTESLRSHSFVLDPDFESIFFRISAP